MFSLDDILEGTQGQLDPATGALAMTGLGFSGVVTDSRGWLAGALFVALRGRFVDGHDFVLDAAGHGARGAVVRSDWRAPDVLPPDVALIRVDDPHEALRRLAAWWRGRLNARFIAVAGTDGTGPTIQVLSSVLASRYATLRPVDEPAGETGVLLTILRASPDHDWIVLNVDVGLHPDRLADLCRIASPDILVVTATERHQPGVAVGAWLCALPGINAVVLHRDGPTQADPADTAARSVLEQARLITYGLQAGCDIQATDIESHGYEGVHFTLVYNPGQEQWPVRLPLFGHYSVQSALAAAGAAHAAGMHWQEIVPALNRLDSLISLLVEPGYNGCTLIDDCYGSSPRSMIQALNLLQDMPGRHIAVLGGMLEDTGGARDEYLKVARRATVVAQRLVVLGSVGLLIGQEALRVGMAPERVFFAADSEQGAQYLRRIIKPGDCVLVQGQRALRPDVIVQALRA